MFSMKAKTGVKSRRAARGGMCCLQNRRLYLLIIAAVAIAVAFAFAFRNSGIAALPLLLLCPLMHLLMMRGGHKH